MSLFQIYFGYGKDHILDWESYDHIAFVIALCALYIFRDWKRVLVLVTAFTIGHSITLALATFHIIEIRSVLAEFLISVTIFITAVSNLFVKEENLGQRRIQINYVFALFFGLIHGLGFSNSLQAILGREKNIASPLLAFNLGLEFGQIIIVAIFMTICFLLVDIIGVSRRDWKMVISSAVAGIALILMMDRKLW